MIVLRLLPFSSSKCPMQKLPRCSQHFSNWRWYFQQIPLGFPRSIAGFQRWLKEVVPGRTKKGAPVDMDNLCRLGDSYVKWLTLRIKLHIVFTSTYILYIVMYNIYIYIDTPVWIWGQQVFFWRVVQIAKTVGQKILPQSMWQMSHFLRCFVYSNCCGISEPSIILHSPRSHVWMQSRRTYSSLYFENFLNGVRLG